MEISSLLNILANSPQAAQSITKQKSWSRTTVLLKYLEIPFFSPDRILNVESDAETTAACISCLCFKTEKFFSSPIICHLKKVCDVRILWLRNWVGTNARWGDGLVYLHALTPEWYVSFSATLKSPNPDAYYLKFTRESSPFILNEMSYIFHCFWTGTMQNCNLYCNKLMKFVHLRQHNSCRLVSVLPKFSFEIRKHAKSAIGNLPQRVSPWILYSSNFLNLLLIYLPSRLDNN